MDNPAHTKPLIHHHSLPRLLIIPIALLLLSIILLDLSREMINIPFIYSQCHARSRLPVLSHIPVLGAPVCFLLSFVLESLSSIRGRVIMGVYLSLLTGLWTVSLLESARVCNVKEKVLRWPTAIWSTVVALPGGGVLVGGVLVPVLLRRGRDVAVAGREEGVVADVRDPDRGVEMRYLDQKGDGVAVPVSVLLGCVVPGVVMLVTKSPVAVGVWLLFPVWTALVRMGVREVVNRFGGERVEGGLQMARDWKVMLWMYAVPVLASAVAHGFLVWSLFARRDDRKEMARATTKAVEIEMGYMLLSMVYFGLVEAGWRTAGVMILATVLAGPGAGVCLGWVYRETIIDGQKGTRVVAVGARPRDPEEAGEETPLLR